jgi:ribosomal protein L40E
VIVCKKCGNQNPDGETFCTSCRAFLEWSGEKVVEAQPEPPPLPPTPEPQPDFVDRVKQAVGLDRPKTDGAPPVPDLVAPVAAIPTSQTPPAAPAFPSATSQAAVATPTSSPVPPVLQASPAPFAAVAPQPSAIPPARAPQAVAPAPEKPRQAPKVDTATGQRFKPGDLICGQCGAGNNPDRHFCQRCGASLSMAVAVKTPWYRKLFPARRPVAAGDRSAVKVSTGPSPAAGLLRWVAVGVVVLLLLAYAVVPGVRTKVNDSVGSAYTAARRHFSPVYDAVRPVSATASSEVATHPARLTIDLLKPTYWAANVAADKQPVLKLSFASPVDLDRILITSGAAQDYATLARPDSVKLVFSDKSTTTLTIQDDPNPQAFDISAKQVTYVEIQILSVYPSAQSTDVAINEVEFFKLQ